MRKLLAVALCLVGLAGCTSKESGSGREGQPDPLANHTSCTFADGLRVAAVDRLPASVHSRRISFPDGSRNVSLADGYRVMFAYPPDDYFVNLKVELSIPAEYASDRKLILRQMELLAQEGDRLPLEHREFHGYDLYAVHRATITDANVLSMYSMFQDRDRKIVTVYFLTGDPAKRRFQTVDEHKRMRERFLEEYFTCVDKRGG